jgi:hypothetical protein
VNVAMNLKFPLYVGILSSGYTTGDLLSTWLHTVSLVKFVSGITGDYSVCWDEAVRHTATQYHITSLRTSHQL